MRLEKGMVILYNCINCFLYDLHFHLLNTLCSRSFSLTAKRIWTSPLWHFSNFIQTLESNLAESRRFSMTWLLIFKEEVL